MNNSTSSEERSVLTSILRTNLSAFVQRGFSEVAHGAKLVMEPYVLLTTEKLALVEQRRIRRLIINMPPRHLKSFMTSVFLPAWMLGRNPHCRIMIVCHQLELAERFRRSTGEVMATKWYRDAFPEAAVRSDRNSASEFETVAGGGVKTASVRSGVTGHGADVIVIDDPLDAKNVTSDVELANVTSFYEQSLSSRLDDPKTGAIIVVAQRLHEKDLCGHLLRSGAWDQLTLPFIAPDDVTYELENGTWNRRKGEVLSPVRFGAAEIASIRNLPAHVFQTQWQQEPTAISAGLVKELDFPRSPEFPLSFSRCVVSWDLALKDGPHSNFSVCLIAREVGGKLFIVDVWRDRLDFEGLHSVAAQLIARWKPTQILIEDTALGPALAGQLSRAGHNVITIGTRGKSKVERLQNNIDRVKSHDVVLCPGPWNEAFLNELVGFPFGHDDQVDALTQLLGWTRENPSSPPKQYVTNPARNTLQTHRNPQRDRRMVSAWR